MEELGLGDDPSDITITVSCGSTSASGTNQLAVLQQSWQTALGINVEADQSEWATFWTDCKNGDKQIGHLAWSGEVDISFLFNLFLSDSAQMPCFYYTEEYDEVIAAAAKETDTEKRFDLYEEAEKMICVDNCQVIPIYYNVTTGVLQDYVKGWDYNVFSTAGHKGMYIEGKTN